ncbi:MAG: penicillin-binding protein 2 [Candidatus Adlerbacteria bacterium]|nr:penicillin-binding protein 2 [Candidatus Adlerbacteria bacterium]
MNKRFLGRVRMLTLFFVTVSLVLVGRLYFLQIVRGPAYTTRADAQFTEPATSLPTRGIIYFSDNAGTEIAAAVIKDGFAIAVNPTKVTDAEALWTALQGAVTLSHDAFIAKATKSGSQYQLVAQHLSGDVGEALQAKQLPGLIVQQDRWRSYPGGSLAAQEIGFVAYNGGDSQEGRYGLERQYNQTLERSAQDLYKNFFVELFGGVKSVLEGAPQEGDIITTIEPSVQSELERQLALYDSTWHPKLAGGIIMNPQNGEIYAMAVAPTFDLNAFNLQTNPLVYANPLVQNVYEMGSIFKPLTMAAGIDSGAVTENTTYNDTGSITVDGKKISNFDFKARGVIPMQQILSQSLNVGASFVATRMGSATMRNYFLDHYGLGSTTGIDMPGEVRGIVGNLSSPRQVEYDTASFGQGIANTPVETVRALATLANGGYLVTPHLVRAIRYTVGITKPISLPEKVQVLKPETSTTVSRMLTAVVDTALAKGEDKIEHYSVAAKTGTAQIANPSGGGYYSDRFLHSFVGYFPSYNAKFIVFLFAVEPVGAPYASTTLAPPWHELTQFLINYYNVPPDR